MQQQFEIDDQQQQNDFYNQMEGNKLPSMLNVLTILTMIACAFILISSIYNYATVDKKLVEMKAMVNNKEEMDKLPEFAKKMMSQDMIDMMQKQADNKLPVFIFGLVGAILCFWGALEMRKRKMNGYYYWLVGEILPLVGTPIFVGMSMYKGFGAIGVIFPIVFIILYTTQRKHLTN